MEIREGVVILNVDKGVSDVDRIFIHGLVMFLNKVLKASPLSKMILVAAMLHAMDTVATIAEGVDKSADNF